MPEDVKKRSRARRIRIAGLVLGVVLAVACRFVPDDYQAACNVVAEFAAIGGCGV
jgi:hypothetical protein